MKDTLCVYVGALLLSLFLIFEAEAQTKPGLQALRVESDSQINIDGLLDEDEWQRAAIATGFTQRSPVDGAKPSQQTEVRVLYTDRHIYIGAKAFDTAPDSIAATLFRRDGTEYSDWFYVSIDSYNDNRTAFTFGINPSGVQKDIMYFNDTEEDVLWDAVWDASTQINGEGWVAEIRIPLSQLRFTSSETEQQWGINFQRRIARYEEINFWSPTPREEFGIVSWFGNLEGIRDLTRPLRLEIQPYVSGELTREPDPGNNDPFYSENDYSFKIGGDIKYGITSDFTLTGTINPDFGQVEADPATINLTAFETYFEERRPFFLEGSDIFNFGSTGSQNTFSTHENFYSRRIGKEPSGMGEQAGVPNFFENRPNETTIAGAAKVSGKTENGLSLGFLNAYTLEENAEYYSADQSLNDEYIIEPATNYMVSRIRQDLKGGDAQIGGFLSSVNRDLQASYLEDYLHSSAYQVGVDGHYYWGNRNWGASGVLAVSQVNGTENALIQTQTSSARYLNRTDSKNLSVDSSRTSMAGYYGEFSIGKYSGVGLRYSFTYSEMSPEYEVNDIGFQERADYRAPHYYAEYLNISSDMFRIYLLWLYASHAWNFDGDMVMNYYGSGGYFQFHNLWTLQSFATFTGRFYNDRITRGGPIMLRPKDWSIGATLTSNSTKDFYAALTTNYRQDASGENMTTLSTTLTYRPTGYIQLELSPTYIKEKNTDQYQAFDNFDADPEFDYLFSDSYLDIFYTEFRLNWTFSPKLSLQTYIRPLLYTADFQNFKTFEEGGTYKFEPLSQPMNDAYEPAFDFNYQTVQGNAVLRWEYRPGSTIFFVWQQERENFMNSNLFEPLHDTGDIFKQDPVNVFLVKFSYWFGS